MAPDAGRCYEIERCRWWLERGQVIEFPGGHPGLITVHPSFPLRLPEAGTRAREDQLFLAALLRPSAAPRDGRRSRWHAIPKRCNGDWECGCGLRENVG